MTNPPGKPKYQIWQIAIIAILTLILIILVVPGVRASVSAWLGLSVAPSSQVTSAPATLVAVATSKPIQAASEAPSSYTESSSPAAEVPGAVGTIDFNQLSSQTGWDVLTPSWLPEGYQFQSAYFDTNQKMLVLTYLVTRPLPDTSDPLLTSSETITLLESQTNDFVPMQVAPNTTVTDVQVNGNPAAFTRGGWDTEFVKDNKEPGGGKMVSSWRNDLQVKNLYWQVGKVFLTLVTADENVSQQDMIEIATSIDS
ncbi:MAG: hypothetical protein C3F13_07090 [Anaerolineales bacterium]|nr:hypothetical protein [Anaerolineae bacterium]PWB54292.1 MAG: hypothetical protein C3F13_07090 [Anaerolineales bacterium]